jgi:hypothetical protein
MLHAPTDGDRRVRVEVSRMLFIAPLIGDSLCSARAFCHSASFLAMLNPAPVLASGTWAALGPEAMEHLSGLLNN